MKRKLKDLRQGVKIAFRNHPKAYKIALSRMDDIQEKISQGHLGDFVEEAYDEAYSKIILAKDIVRFDMNDAYTEAEGMLNDLEAVVNDLGLDTPREIADLHNELVNLGEEISEWERKIDQFWS
jgi:hypothetical protein